MDSGRVFARRASWGVRGLPRGSLSISLELERDEVQELPMLLRPGSVGDGGAEEPGEHEQLSVGTAGRGRDVDGLGATRSWAPHSRCARHISP